MPLCDACKVLFEIAVRGRSNWSFALLHLERTRQSECWPSRSELPTHVHTLNGTSTAVSQPVPTGACFATSAATDPIYGTPSSLVAMAAGALANTGGSQAHLNMQPFLILSFCIALQGIFPSPN